MKIASVVTVGTILILAMVSCGGGDSTEDFDSTPSYEPALVAPTQTVPIPVAPVETQVPVAETPAPTVIPPVVETQVPVEVAPAPAIETPKEVAPESTVEAIPTPVIVEDTTPRFEFREDLCSLGGWDAHVLTHDECMVQQAATYVILSTFPEVSTGWLYCAVNVCIGQYDTAEEFLGADPKTAMGWVVEVCNEPF